MNSGIGRLLHLEVCCRYGLHRQHEVHMEPICARALKLQEACSLLQIDSVHCPERSTSVQHQLTFLARWRAGTNPQNR